MNSLYNKPQKVSHSDTDQKDCFAWYLYKIPFAKPLKLPDKYASWFELRISQSHSAWGNNRRPENYQLSTTKGIDGITLMWLKLLIKSDSVRIDFSPPIKQIIAAQW